MKYTVPYELIKGASKIRIAHKETRAGQQMIAKQLFVLTNDGNDNEIPKGFLVTDYAYTPHEVTQEETNRSKPQHTFFDKFEEAYTFFNS